ncbi:MAG: MFS transporter [Ktedonobacteraceae bacterium]
MSPTAISPRSQDDHPSQFWLYGMLIALFVSNTGTSLQLATQAWFVWEVSHRPATVGVLGLVQATPLLGVPLLGGVLADRFPRQRLLLMTQGTLALIAALMGSLALAGRLSLPLTLVLSGVLASVSALDNPIRQVYVPGVVETTQRGRMVGLNALTYNAGAIVGPATAGILIPLVGVSWCFLLNGLSYLVVIAWLLAGPAAPPRPAHASNEQTLKVSRYIWNTASVRIMLVLVAVVSLLGRSYPTVLPIVVSRTWGSGAQTYGMLAALPGLGAALAAIFVAWLLGHRKRMVPVWLGGVLLGGAVTGVGMTGNLMLAGLALLATGGFATGTMTLLNASIQETTPNEVRGRVMSLYTWLAAGMPALGGWLLGTMMGIWTAQGTLVTGGVTLIVVTLIMGWGTRRDVRSANREMTP